MTDDPGESVVRDCYAGWSKSYYDDYYSADAPYPPVHRDLVIRLLREAGARRILDAGCGPASFLRELVDEEVELAGFDLTTEMVDEARAVLAGRGEIWQGSVLDPNAFRRGAPYDAAVCIGVLPHVAEGEDELVLANLRASVRDGGLVVVEARNALFALLTLNRHSRDLFVETLIDDPELARLTAEELDKRFRIDLPPVRDYDRIRSRTHNPILLEQQFETVGFRGVRRLYYHFHAAPPLVEPLAAEQFRRASLAMEDPDDWRGLVMASAFLLVGRRG
jgi:SAM-dependent methyltransferase